MKDWQHTGLAGVNIRGSPVGSCNHIHWRGLSCGLRGLSRMCGAVCFGNASEIWSLKVLGFFFIAVSSVKEQLLLSLLAFPPPIPSPGCFAFWETGEGLWWSERGQKERRKKVNNSTQTVYGRCWGKRVISAGLPLGASCFSALFKWISPPTPSPVPILPFFSPQSLFPLSLSFFFLPPPLHTFLSFVFISPPAVFLDRNLTHAFPFRISIGLFCPLFSPCLGPLFFLCLLSQSETAASLLGQDDSALAFPVPALPTSVQLLSPGRGGFGMVGWQRQGDWYKNEVQKRGERELGGGREMV